LSALLGAGGGFLLAVLWMDLMFDVQVLPHRGENPLPEDVLASIAAYYRRVTTTARPLGHLVALAMAVTAGAAVVAALRAFRTGAPLELHAAAFVLVAAPAALALFRVVPNAVRLGSRRDPPEIQTALARGICRDHLFCLASITAFVALQVALASRS
jgi:hypothetical protein